MVLNPHALIEGCDHARNAIELARAYIFIRGEYATEAEVLDAAIAQAYARGYLGTALPGAPGAVDIYVHRGAGAYICGEETALLSALERRARPADREAAVPGRVRAWKSPTLLNNVETVMTVPYIFAMGAERYAAMRTEQTTGTRRDVAVGPRAAPGQLRAAASTRPTAT